LQKVTVLNKTRGRLLGDQIGRADTSSTRRIGLLQHTGLNKGEGLWIVPTQAIHTFFMKFAIDVLFLDRQKRVLKAVPRLGPWRLSGSWRARTVLELPAGTIEETGTDPGDVLEITSHS
jgi:uncharacterized membrane protein (UPF0127 family)